VLTFKKWASLKAEMLSEALITFGGNAYPKAGNIVILAGGAGSGKGFIRSKLLGIEGKVLDVDAIKSLVLAAPKIKEKAKKEFGVDLDKMDLRTPEHVSAMHNIVANTLNIPRKLNAAFFASVLAANPQSKPNIIFDVTLRDIGKFDSIVSQAKMLGYDAKNIHIVWVVNDVEVAREQNQKRDRVVSADVLTMTHVGSAMTMKTILEMSSGLRSLMDGDIVLAFNKIDVDSEVVRSGRGGMHVKDANYIFIKRQGKAPLSPTDLGVAVLRKIAEYTPKSESWHDLLDNMSKT
jgi:hypothetical protein